MHCGKLQNGKTCQHVQIVGRKFQFDICLNQKYNCTFVLHLFAQLKKENLQILQIHFQVSTPMKRKSGNSTNEKSQTNNLAPDHMVDLAMLVVAK